MKDNILKVAISIPTEGHTLPESYDNHLLVAKHVGTMEERWIWEKRNPCYEFYWHTVGRLLTPMAREMLINAALKGEMDYILMFDDDMVLPIDMVECMLQDMEHNPEIDILAPLAFQRNAPHLPVMYITIDGYDPVNHKTYFKSDFVKNYPKDTLVECDAVGFGAVLIKMEMIKKMKPPYCFSTTGAGEDVYFCWKAKRETGARVFMDTRIKLGHLANPKVIDEEFVEKWRKENKFEVLDVPYKYTNIEK